VKLTTARYYTPGGRSIQAKGIAPDIVVDDAADQKVLLREADLQRHLSIEDDKSTPGAPAKGAKPTEKIIAGPSAGKSATAPVTAKATTAKADAKDEKKDPNAKKEDLQLAAALTFLKAPAAPPTTAAATAVTK
jgi:carboxyl-terminal processing protease